MSTLKRFGRRWGPALLLMSVIFWASHTPSDDLPDFGVWDTLAKKLAHAAGYALLALAYLHGLSDGQPPTARRAALSVALASLYAMTDEFHQTFVAGRTASALDVMIDTAGAALGMWLRIAWASVRPLERRE